MKRITKTINIIEGVFNIDPFFVCQFFYVYPRYMLSDYSHATNIVNNFLNNSYIGDNFKKLILNSHIRRKFLDGILEVVVYDNKSTPVEEKLIKYFGTVMVPEENGCWCCLYNSHKKCALWKFRIRDERFSCEDWEEKEVIYERI